jgi:hypothetical protein
MSHALETLGSQRAAPGEFNVHAFSGSDAVASA